MFVCKLTCFNALLDIFGGSQYGSAEGSALISCRMQMIKHDLLQVGLHLLHLSQNYAALSFDLGLAERTILQNVRQDVDGLWQVLAERLCVVDGLFPGSVGGKVSADIFNFELEVSLSASFGSLKY